ncbi:hypothetical protein [Methylocapsa sp. S129]|uniref:hypothetical protein n=1 Tax=Methylocapsa sp. S129 TaxID=1641869 RepID=UPI00131C1DCC|nr:hypothetical protein [Methylocapsa sp. S129]
MKRVAIGFLCLSLIASFAVAGLPAANAQQSSSWNGEWAGHWEQGQGAQIIFAGDDLIGIYWRGDYISETHAVLSRGGAVVAISWASGEALLTRDGPLSAHIVIHEKGRPEASFAVKKDH